LTRYDAFISYSHAAQGRLAPALQRGLRRFARAWPRRPTLEVFRDETSLSASPGLWPTIERALTASKRFVLLASPESARSKWVQQELAWWLAHKDAQTILIVLTDGALRWNDTERDFDWSVTTALPALLKGAFPDEPHYVDLGWARDRDDLDLRNVRFKNAIRPLVAALHEKRPEELDGEDVRAQRAQRLAAIVIAAGLTIALVVTAWSWINAEAQRRMAEQNARRALAGQLAAEGRADIGESFDRALLRAVAAVQLEPTPETYGALEAVLSAHPHIEAFLAPADLGAIEGIALSRDGRRAITLNDLNQVIVWDVEARVPLHLLVDGRTDESEARVSRVALSGDGTLAATGTDGGAVRFWSVATGEVVHQSLDVKASMWALALDEDGGRAAATGTDGALVIWDARGGQPIASMRAGVEFASARLAFSADSRRLAAVAADGELAVWNAASGALLERRKKWPGGNAASNGATSFEVALDSAGRLVAVECGPNRITLRDVRAPQPAIRTIDAYAGKTAACALSGDGTWVISGAEDATVLLWAVAGRRPIGETLGQQSGGIVDLSFSRDGRYLDAVSHSGGTKRWTLATRTVGEVPTVRSEGFAFEPPRGPEFDRAVPSGDGRLEVAIEHDETATLWDLVARQSLGPLPAPGDSGVKWAAFSPDDRLLAIGDRDGAIIVWDLQTREIRAGPLAGHDAEVFLTEYAQPKAPQTQIENLVFSPDGGRLLSVTGDGTARVWHLVEAPVSGALLPRDAGKVDAAAFNGDGSRLATLIAGRVVVWDLGTLRQVGAPLGDGVTALAYAPDGGLLATGSAVGTIILWEVGSASRLRRACAIANRNLTCDEWRRSAGDQPYMVACPDLRLPVGCAPR
jgi:WD40 repeat protein